MLFPLGLKQLLAAHPYPDQAEPPDGWWNEQQEWKKNRPTGGDDNRDCLGGRIKGQDEQRGKQFECDCDAGEGPECGTVVFHIRSVSNMGRYGETCRAPVWLCRGPGMSRIWPGKPSPLGPTFDGKGTNFAIVSEHAECVELCLFEDGGIERRLELPQRTGHVWHGYVPEVGPGQRYGYRVYGPYDPEHGHRFNPAKLLIDPYARALDGQLNWDGPVNGYRPGRDDLIRDDRDDAPAIPRCLIIDGDFDWEGDTHPEVPWSETVIFEMHVKGFTKLHPKVDREYRGTYLGLASPPMLEYLTDLGITSVELLPIHAFFDERELRRRGLVNYWGYNSINFFAPANRYATSGKPGAAVREFKQMVKTLHRAGIEVILDVVYNHTAEGNHLGPTFSFKGIDNLVYYRTVPGKPRHYVDYTGCGNTLNTRHPVVLRLLMDSLRYWIQEMHVDGFRFDLASTLAREEHAVDRMSSFFDAIYQDPVVSGVKLIAEPWDLGDGGYQVGNFPAGWSEWNGRYRDCVRAFWRGDAGMVPEMGYRLTGSSDLYQASGRNSWASINFVTAHDGFTLNDLVSYNEKHNEANGDGNRDGTDYNLSNNMGVEGPANDPAVLVLRDRQRRNFLTTLLVSSGVPMILAGDELGRTQRGNNNAYCQDNPTSWTNWDLEHWQCELQDFTRRLIALRRQEPALRRQTFYRGTPHNGSTRKDLAWLRADGQEMTADDWANRELRTFGMLISGDALEEVDATGNPIRGNSLLVLFNSGTAVTVFTLPNSIHSWELVIDTSRPYPATRRPDSTFVLPSHAMAVLIDRSPPQPAP